MTCKPVSLIDSNSVKVATLNVQFQAGQYEGTLSFGPGQAELQQLFEQFEDIVEGQMFSLLDDMEAKIEALALKAQFEDGREAEVTDLQVFPSTNAVSFKTRQAATAWLRTP